MNELKLYFKQKMLFKLFCKRFIAILFLSMYLPFLLDITANGNRHARNHAQQTKTQTIVGPLNNNLVTNSLISI